MKSATPGNLISPLLSAVIDSISRWLVGSSNISTLEPIIIILDIRHLTFSPPESTLTFLTPSSPANNIRPRKPLTYVGSGSGEYCVSHSTIVSSLLNSAALSLGKYACEVVTPHLYEPSSGSILPVRILNKVVVANSLEPTNAILSSLLTINDILSSTLTPSIVLEIPST